MGKTFENKVDKYYYLLKSQERLIKSSQDIIRKRKSPLARQILQGDVRAILKASKDRLYGSLSYMKRQKLCKLLCELKAKIKNKNGELSRELFSWFITGAIGIISTAGGLIIALLWVLREKQSQIICKCKLDNTCGSESCLSRT